MEGKRACQACEKLCGYGDCSQFQRRFMKLCAGDFELSDASWSGSPTEVGDNKINALIQTRVTQQRL